jgi:hypothetical protein
MKRIQIVALLLGLLGSSFLVTSPSVATDSSEISDYGNASISELATCLRTSPTLDVYYLIDNSESLRTSDKNKERAQIVSEDIRRWADIGSLQPNLKISVAGAKFDSKATTFAGWQSLSKSNADSVGKRFSNSISNSALQPFTNWRAGLQKAYDDLSSRDSQCKAVIWFTDGGLYSAQKREDSLRDLAVLCGPAESGRVTSESSSEGLMAKIRRAGIHVYGILLNSGKDTEEDESFYRSLMKPLVEESGQVTGSGQHSSGPMKCGENLVGENKDYASGAFLKATSAADVAFKFMKIGSVVAGGTEAPCTGDGFFWVDPGIGAVEFNTDAKTWTIEDETGKVIKQSQVTNDKGWSSTSKVSVPPLEEPVKWRFIPKGGTGICKRNVYPELYLELHDKALIGGQQSSITGQFFKDLNTQEKIDLRIYKNVELKASVNRSPQTAKLDTASGVFEIEGFKPKESDSSVDVGATLSLQTQHYKLDPISFSSPKRIYDPKALPSVGKVSFGEPLYGSKGTTTASVTISTPEDSTVPSRVCFARPEVISDIQSEAAGKATDRTKTWDWKFVGLNGQNCVDLLSGTNREQKVQFILSNPKQASAQGVAKFPYTIESSLDESLNLKSSETASFETEEQRSASLFWLYLIAGLIAGLSIPFLILRALNKRNAVFAFPEDLQRAEIAVTYSFATNSFRRRSLGEGLEEDVRLLFNTVDLDKSTVKVFDEPLRETQGALRTFLSGKRMTFMAVAPKWPLKDPSFYFSDEPGYENIVSTQNSFSENESLKELSTNKIASLAIFTAEARDINSAIHNQSDVDGALIIYDAEGENTFEQAITGNLIARMKDRMKLGAMLPETLDITQDQDSFNESESNQGQGSTKNDFLDT